MNPKYISYSQNRDLRPLFWGNDQLMLPSEVAERLKIKKWTLWRLVKEGKIKCLRLDTKVFRYWKSDIERYLTKKEGYSYKIVDVIKD